MARMDYAIVMVCGSSTSIASPIEASSPQLHISRCPGPARKSMGSPWSPENPDRTVILRLAENSLLHDDIAQSIKAQITVNPLEHLTYSTGPRGSRRLRRAAAAFLTEEFQSRETIIADNIFITPGLASANGAITWSICDEGEGGLIPQPFYNGFAFDTLNRSNAQVVGVTYQEIEGNRGLLWTQ